MNQQRNFVPDVSCGLRRQGVVALSGSLCPAPLDRESPHAFAHRACVVFFVIIRGRGEDEYIRAGRRDNLEKPSDVAVVWIDTSVYERESP